MWGAGLKTLKKKESTGAETWMKTGSLAKYKNSYGSGYPSSPKGFNKVKHLLEACEVVYIYKFLLYVKILVNSSTKI